MHPVQRLFHECQGHIILSPFSSLTSTPYMAQYNGNVNNQRRLTSLLGIVSTHRWMSKNHKTQPRSHFLVLASHWDNTDTGNAKTSWFPQQRPSSAKENMALENDRATKKWKRAVHTPTACRRSDLYDVKYQREKKMLQVGVQSDDSAFHSPHSFGDEHHSSPPPPLKPNPASISPPHDYNFSSTVDDDDDDESSARTTDNEHVDGYATEEAAARRPRPYPTSASSRSSISSLPASVAPGGHDKPPNRDATPINGSLGRARMGSAFRNPSSVRAMQMSCLQACRYRREYQIYRCLGKCYQTDIGGGGSCWRTR